MFIKVEGLGGSLTLGTEPCDQSKTHKVLMSHVIVSPEKTDRKQNRSIKPITAL